jgi:hypothetical protein
MEDRAGSDVMAKFAGEGARATENHEGSPTTDS